jgi:NAD(P)-dependent dehydrogenase (short-subunit alcohol dehydrogenase family)
MGRLDGKVAFVTGAGGAIAQRFAIEGAAAPTSMLMRRCGRLLRSNTRVAARWRMAVTYRKLPT